MALCMQTKEILNKSNYRMGNIIVENKANKKKVPELPVLMSVTTVSSGLSSW